MKMIHGEYRRPKYHTIEIERWIEPGGKVRPLAATVYGWESVLPIARFSAIVEESVRELSTTMPQTSATEVADPGSGEGIRVVMSDAHADVDDAKLIARIAKKISKVSRRQNFRFDSV